MQWFSHYLSIVAKLYHHYRGCKTVKVSYCDTPCHFHLLVYFFKFWYHVEIFLFFRSSGIRGMVRTMSLWCSTDCLLIFLVGWTVPSKLHKCLLPNCQQTRACMFMTSNKPWPTKFQFQVTRRLTWYVLVRALQCFYVKKKKKKLFARELHDNDRKHNRASAGQAMLEQYARFHARGQHSASKWSVFLPSHHS